MSFLSHIVLGCCPRCAKGRIFSDFLTMRSHCPTCNLHIAAREQGDGPAFFGIVVIGALAVIGAATVEMLYEPPYWVHAAIWPLFVIVGSLVSLRFAKAALINIQYTLRPQDFD